MRPAIGGPISWKRNERSEPNEFTKTGAAAAPVFSLGSLWRLRAIHSVSYNLKRLFTLKNLATAA
jgi:hypothetical protein